ncbi:PKD domain-containing protein [Maribacter luteus]|uniref:PKD domain-containing protein n=1 Tax=Maribacter luteus TaxID=2594478 RepID=UPI002492232C|nr:PKD domain-containing protein [Maribacter luteus]
MQYHIVDITFDGGLGAVVTKNQVLRTPVSEKLTATLDDTGANTWILAHELGNNSFLAYLLTPTGLNTTPVVSNSGPIIQAGAAITNFRGNMKISPNGEYLCYASGGDSSLNLFRFDKATGIVSNPLDITNFPTQPFKQTPNKFYGVEFSPNNYYLYAGTSYVSSSGLVSESQMWQFSLADYDAGLITFRATFLSPGFSNEIGGIQLAPDGKIYVAHKDRPFLSVIDDPDAAGSDDMLSINAIDLQGRNSTLGLPNFTDINIDVDMFVDDLCSNQATDFLVESNYDIVSQLWDFGDGIISNIPNPNHVYGIPGDYTVSVTIQTLVGSATETMEITILETPIANQPTDFGVCTLEQFVAFDLCKLPLKPNCLKVE